MRTEFIDISSKVREVIKEKHVNYGVCYIYVPHTTAAVTINEGADPSVKHDILQSLSQLVPKDANYTHMEGNSDAHIKSSLIGASIAVPIEDGRPILGTWQGIFFCEFDGPRNRRVSIKIIEG